MRVRLLAFTLNAQCRTPNLLQSAQRHEPVATVPADDRLPPPPILLDLDQETDIIIAKALRPGLLPPAVYAYLSPRQRVTYYFDSNAQAGQGPE